jgi:3-methyladenine DNA glycosylase/8-oxoguanine DNA glycosylase
LGDNFDAFRNAARRTEALISVVMTGARLIRGATLLEDAVTAAIAQRHADGTPDYEPVAWVVDRLGDPLPSNPTFHAFPTAQQLIEGRDDLLELFDDNVVDSVLSITEILAAQSRHLRLLIRSTLSANDLASELKRTFRLSPPSLSLLMLAVGRYDYIPTDTWARFRVRRYLHEDKDVSPADVRHFFEPWQPWGGLAYWLWDWTAVPASSDVRLR